MAAKAERPSDVFRRRLREARNARGWSAQQLAEAAGIYPTVVYKLETGQRKAPTLDEVVELAVALNVSPMHLFVPLEDEAKVRVGHRTVTDAQTVRSWVRGRRPLDMATAAAVRFYIDQSPEDVPVRLADAPQEVRAELVAEQERRLGALGITTERED